MRLLPVGPDHVRLGAAREQPASDATPTSTTRCPATSAAAAPMCASAKRSSRPRNRADREADHDPRSHRFRGRPGRSHRRRSLPAQLPAGRSGRRRRPAAEPEPAVRQRRGRSGRRRRLRAERLHPHRQRRADRPDHALCRDGPGHLHLDPDADRRGARGRPGPGAARACPAQRQALRQSAAAAFRRPAARPRSAAPGSRCARPARPREPCSSRRRRSAGTSIRRPAARKAARCSTRRAGRRLDYGELAADAARMPVPENVALKRAGGLQAHRHAGQAARHAGEGQRHGRLRHRRPAAGREDRDARAIARLRRPAEERGR